VILSGVKPGDQVATSGSFKLREGALVALADNSQGGAPADSGQGAGQADSSQAAAKTEGSK